MQIPAPYRPLEPLNQQQEYDSLESEWRAIFIEVFEQMLAPKIRDLSHYGSPHLGSIAVMKQFTTYEGLSSLRSDVENYRLSYLLKAWRAKNPKRGFHFLNTFLQMLYPNNFNVLQMWQEKGQPYPQVLRDEYAMRQSGLPHWLTSRVVVEVSDWTETGDNLVKYQPELQAIIGARFLLMASMLRNINESSLAIASGFSAFSFIAIDCEFSQ